MAFHYGITSKNHLCQLADRVCDTIGHGTNYTAMELLVETAAAETQCGQFKDPTPNGAGYGLTQFDRIGFEDVKTRTRFDIAQKVAHELGRNVYTAKFEDLAEDPLLALIFTRLKYWLRPEIIPTALCHRAQYWKTFYNTKAGKGTTEHYIESAQRHLPNGAIACLNTAK